MIYFFINVMMYLIIVAFLIKYFQNKMTITSLIIILFNLNIYFFFIYRDINFMYGLLFFTFSITLYQFINLFDKQQKEVILISNGNINFHEIINHYSYHRLINYLKKRHIKLSEVDYCLKIGNKLTIIKNQKIY